MLGIGWQSQERLGNESEKSREFHAGNIIQNSFIQKVGYFKLFYINMRKFHAKLVGNTGQNVRKR